MSIDSINNLQEKLKQNPNDIKLIEEYAIALSDIGENEEALKNFHAQGHTLSEYVEVSEDYNGTEAEI